MSMTDRSSRDIGFRTFLGICGVDRLGVAITYAVKPMAARRKDFATHQSTSDRATREVYPQTELTDR